LPALGNVDRERTGFMTDSGRRTAGTSGNADWLSRVADEAAGEAGVPVALLGEYLQILAVAAMEGRQPSTDQLAALRGQGRRVAEEGVGADRAVDLFLSAAWRLWRAVPTATVGEDSRRAAETLLRVVNQAVEVLVDGHQAARREMIRREESTRRELVDDLLRGDADVARLVRRAQPFGLDLGRFHRVVLAEPSASSRARPDRAAGPMEREVVDRYGDREVMVATKDDFVVLILPAGPAGEQLVTDHRPVTDFVTDRLRRHTGTDGWRVAAGRAHAGAYGIATSYEEAREVLGLARRLRLDAATVRSRDLLLYRVIGRDREALVDLVEGLLAPLLTVRGGPEPFLQTLEAYFGTGSVATETARRLHVSVRTVTYRLARIRTLTGADPTDASGALALEVAVLGARLLGWPVAGEPA
jgi:sugar diacid utilization regulator